MSGSRLGRGRGGRLAVYGGCGVVVILLIFLYRAATSEMARLRELHVQCAHQQEALAAQLQVIFEYKVRLEKSLAEEKSSNAAVKQELQQRASREKSLRDKDSIEAMQRFNSLQQTYKLLQTENQDLQEECKKREKQALEDTNRLEATLQDLRSKIKQARDEKERSLENLKNKYLKLDTEKTKLEEKYQEMLTSNGNTDSIIQHLKKEVFQLKRELEEAKRPSSSSKVTSPGPSLVSPQSSQQADHQSVVRPSQQQQQQSTAATSSIKSPAPGRSESSTVLSSGNPPSTAFDRALPPVKPAAKVKLPVGVVPIPMIMDQKVQNIEDETREQPRKKDEIGQSVLSKNSAINKENDQQPVEPANLGPPFPALQGFRKIDEKVLGRRGNGGWIGVGPGIQEIGDELNQLHGLDDGVDRRQEPGEDQYEVGDYDKEPLKNAELRLAEHEDEGEGDLDEEERLDYPQNLKQEKQ